jgi:DNA modification methylase
MTKNVLVLGDAVDFLSRISTSSAKVVYLDPPHDFEEILGSSRHNVQTYLEYLAHIFFQSHSILLPDGFVAINVPHQYRAEIQATLEHIFAKKNFVTEIIIPIRRILNSYGLGSWHTSILIFSKSDAARLSNLFRPLDDAERAHYNQSDMLGAFRLESLYRIGDRPLLSYDFEGCAPPPGQNWKYSKEKLQALDSEGKIFRGRGVPRLKRYLHESNGRRLSNVWDDIDQLPMGRERTGFPTQQSSVLLDRLLDLLASRDDLIVDPFCGSGTSLMSSFKKDMKWLGCDVAPSAISIAQERFQTSELTKEVAIQSIEEFSKENQQQRRPHKNVDVNLRAYLQKSVSRTKLNKNVFRKRIAFVIGIEDYKGRDRNSLSRVDYARNDALAFKNVLVSKLGVNEEDIAMFIDDQADRSSIKYDLIQALSSLTAEDQFLFYYAGHGFQIDSRNYLTTHDTHPNGIAETSLSLQDDILIRLQESKCKSGMFFIDACATETKASPARSFLPNFDGQEFEVVEDEHEYLATFLSCGRGQSSYPSSRLEHGIWTYHLIEALSGKASTALRAEKYVTDHSLMRHLTTEVPKSVKKEYGLKVHQNPRSHTLSSEETIILEIDM